MKKQYSERKYEATKTEIRFEELLKANDFNVLGVRQYNERTDYLIEKDGIKCEYSVYALDNKAKRGDNCYTLFNEYYDLKRKTSDMHMIRRVNKR